MTGEFHTLRSEEFQTDYLAGGLDPEERPIVLADCTKECKEHPYETWNFLLANIDHIAVFEQHNRKTHQDRRIVVLKPGLLEKAPFEFKVVEEVY